MNGRLQNGKSTASNLRQQFLVAMADEASANGNGHSELKTTKPRGQKRPCAPQSTVTLAKNEHLQGELEQIEKRLLAVESLLREIHEKTVLGSIVKEYYTTQEVARLLSKRPYTVREWCRLGRVHGEKSHSGRGLDEEWRISHVELTRIQNEGLLPIKTFADVERPRRLK